MDDEAFVQESEAHAVDFLDFGANRDGVLAMVKKAFGGKNGLGLDTDPQRVAEAQRAGEQAMVWDPAKGLDLERKVRFSAFVNYLNRTPSFDAARDTLVAALKVTRDFAYIQQPFYDADGYLLSRGLKFFWSDWTRQSNRLTSLDFHNIFASLAERGIVHGLRIYGATPVRDSLSPDILPLAARSNQNRYEAEQHGEKPFAAFDRVVFRELKILVARRPECDLDKLEKRFRWDKQLLATGARE